LEDHRRALTEPTWKYVLNYETDCMTRDQIVAATYAAAARLAELKLDVGVITEQAYADTIERIRASQAVIAEVDGIMALPAGPEREVQLAAARERHRSVQPQATCARCGRTFCRSEGTRVGSAIRVYGQCCDDRETRNAATGRAAG
jgi:hypothetical protein